VGHELIADGLARTAALRDFQLEWYPGHIAELEKELQGLDASDPITAAVEENLIYNRLFFEAVEANQELMPPTLTFSDRMTLELGDTTFELSYIGGMHTASDAAIFVPERGLLLTGDLMADVWLTDAPGCLGNFMVRAGMPHDFPRFLANWDRLLADRDRITTLMPAHWNGELSIEGAEARVDYVRTLWNAVGEASEEDKTVDDVLTANTLAARFPDLADSPGFSEYGNFSSIAELWREVTGQASAARTLWTMIDDGADDAGLEEILAERDAESPSFFFIEAELNAYGYSFLQQAQPAKAIRMFRINVELYPESWNAYDSLGEALLQAGDTDEAVAMYEKSLALNPENTSGKEVLARIQGAEST
jgi:tetratricopeptide (TPR) repeat protein